MTIDLDADPFRLRPDEIAVLAVLRFGIELGATTSTQSSASFITASAKADVTAHL